MSPSCASHGNGSEEVAVVDNNSKMDGCHVARSPARVSCSLRWKEGIG